MRSRSGLLAYSMTAPRQSYLIVPQTHTYRQDFYTVFFTRDRGSLCSVGGGAYGGEEVGKGVRGRGGFIEGAFQERPPVVGVYVRQVEDHPALRLSRRGL